MTNEITDTLTNFDTSVHPIHVNFTEVYVWPRGVSSIFTKVEFHCLPVQMCEINFNQVYLDPHFPKSFDLTCETTS